MWQIVLFDCDNHEDLDRLLRGLASFAAFQEGTGFYFYSQLPGEPEFQFDCELITGGLITAKAVFGKHFEQTPLLREPQFNQFATGELRLPFSAWKWLLRLSWITGHSSQRACRDEFKRRVVAVADMLTSMNNDVLVVSHAGMMAYLSTELKRRGFSGPSFRFARHANVYTFDNATLQRDATPTVDLP